MIHPETGEVLETREQYRAALNEIGKQLGEIYELRQAILDGRAALGDPPVLPPARSRTQVQERVARCPRCGMKLEASDGS